MCKLKPSGNGFDHLEGLLKTVYGERGGYEHNLTRYATGWEFHDACRSFENLDDVPEVSLEQIRSIANRENSFRRLAGEISAVLEGEGTLKENRGELYREIAGLMGLCPGPCDRLDTLFPHVLDLYVSSEAEEKQIFSAVDANEGAIESMVTLMGSYLIDGLSLDWNGRYVRSQGYARNAFRGENAYYGSSYPSLYRGLSSDSDEVCIRKVAGTARIVEYAKWLQTIPAVKDWPFGDVYHGAIAQHYGLPTNGIDFTSDFQVALFFACCKFEDGCWRPLTSRDFERKDSRSSVANSGGDSRYGMLYSCPMDISNMSFEAKIPKLHFATLHPIGYQPFMRCSAQSAYFVEAGFPYDLQRDRSFSKVKIRLTEDLCQWIYEEMEHGFAIYPKEGSRACEEMARRLRDSKVLSRDSFEHAISLTGLEEESPRIERLLRDRGFVLADETNLGSDLIAEAEESLRETYQTEPYASMERKIKVTFSI